MFMTAWSGSIYPMTSTGLPRKLIKVHNKSAFEPLPMIRLHDLRHVHATLLLLAGVPVHVGAARFGHADPAITLRVYAHVIRSAPASSPGSSTNPVSKSVSKRPSRIIRKGL
ncbi:tyrosine-type recombinase/integrase [Nonomuraea glycinis]|nr:tyrosine-type recombinase/integrase [Nonomuraea glycinis]